MFFIGVVIPAKIRFCNECKGKTIRDRCNIQVNGNNEFEAILNQIKRQPPNQVRQMLPYYK